MTKTLTSYEQELNHALREAFARQRFATPSELSQMAAWQFNAKAIWAANPQNATERRIIARTVHFCLQRGISNIPPVFIIDTPKLNAASVQGSEVIITTGLIKNLSEKQIDAVIGHELSHHRHNTRDDIMQLTLAYVGGGIGHELWKVAAEAVHTSKGGPRNFIAGLLGSTALSTIPVWLGATSFVTPYRHFMELEADKEGAQLTSPADMKDALRQLEAESNKLKQQHIEPDDWKRKLTKTLLYPFSSHPSTEKRIAKLDKIEANMRENAQPQSYADRIVQERSVGTTLAARQ